MDKDQEALAISKLVFELTLACGSGNDLDVLLAQLLSVLEKLAVIRIQPRAAILLRNPRQQLVQVAQHGFPPPWDQPSPTPLESLPLEGQSVAYCIDHDEAAYCVLPLATEGNPIGLVLLAIEPGWRPDSVEIDFLTDLGHALSGHVSRCIVLETLKVREIELEEARTDAIRRLGAASEYRDNETGLHVMRMTHYAALIAKTLGLSEEEREQLYIAAPMHDVGKIGIADAILLKPGRLTADEFAVMKTHTEIGERILRGADTLIAAARDIAAAHHECWDGSGYPKGMKGEEIPIFARICAIADVFDALTSPRPYKSAWPVQEAVDWIRSESGKKFDPTVVAAFDQAMPEILRIRELYRDDIINPHQELNLPPLPVRHRTWIQWDESLSVGIDSIDEHHRYLFDLTNDLYDSVIHKRGAKDVAKTLKNLDQYALIHFDAEERMMEHYGFDHLPRQCKAHQGFRDTLQGFFEELHSAPLTAQFDVLSFLRKWLVGHIRHEDAELRQLVNQAI